MSRSESESRPSSSRRIADLEARVAGLERWAAELSDTLSRLPRPDGRGGEEPPPPPPPPDPPGDIKGGRPPR